MQNRHGQGSDTALQVLSVIIPANNEETFIGGCLQALADQQPAAGPLEVIVSSNASTDRTEEIARSFEPVFAARGWSLRVLASNEPGKMGALNRADIVATGALRAYLDADVICEPALMGQLRAALNRPTPAYATGTLRVATARTWITRRYADFWTRLPFIKGGAVGAGLFAVNGPGRARWQDFPPIISDDTFARLHFAPGERVEVPAAYDWPMVEGFANLVRVRRRQDTGVHQVYRGWPELRGNEGKPRLGIARLAGLGLRAPVSFAVYVSVALSVRLRRGGEWSRGR